MRIAIIENNEVINVIIGNEIPVNGVECPEIVCVGWSYIDEEFVAPAPVYEMEETTE